MHLGKVVARLKPTQMLLLRLVGNLFDIFVNHRIRFKIQILLDHKEFKKTFLCQRKDNLINRSSFNFFFQVLNLDFTFQLVKYFKSKASDSGNVDLVRKCDSYLVGDVIFEIINYFIKLHVSDKAK